MASQTIDSFSGEYSFLSNFYITPVYFEGLMYNCSECAFQSAKSLLLSARQKFIDMAPGKAKREGRKLILRHDWLDIDIRVMTEIVRDKFFRSPELMQKLLDTGDAILIEGNYWNDTYWGVCNGEGKNNLGKILMLIRKEARV